MKFFYPNINARGPLVSTYSIIARDEDTGDMGIAVQSHWFAVGTTVPWVKPGVGIVAIQSFVNLLYSTFGLELMEKGLTSKNALRSLLEKDNRSEIRQVCMMDKFGNISAHTGSGCIKEAGHLIGDNYSVQGNLMAHKNTLELMAEAFEDADGDIANRMIAALKIGDKEDGDIRGKQSACMKIISNETTRNDWEGLLLDVRVDDHKDPVAELERLVNIHQAYQYMNKAEIAFGMHDMEKALEEYAKAQSLYIDNLEIIFWEAISLANLGNYDKSYDILNSLFKKDPNWKIITQRLISAEILTPDIEFIEKLFPDDPKIVDDILEENFDKYDFY